MCEIIHNSHARKLRGGCFFFMCRIKLAGKLHIYCIYYKAVGVFFEQLDAMFLFWKHVVVRIKRFILHHIFWKCRRHKCYRILKSIFKPLGLFCHGGNKTHLPSFLKRFYWSKKNEPFWKAESDFDLHQ